MGQVLKQLAAPTLSIDFIVLNHYTTRLTKSSKLGVGYSQRTHSIESIPFSSAAHSQFWQSEGFALLATRLANTPMNFLAMLTVMLSSLLDVKTDPKQ